MEKFIRILVVVMCMVTIAQAQEGVDMNHVGKLYFSNKPFTNNHDGARTSFTSSENIYGRLELVGGKKLSELLEGADKYLANSIVYLYYWARLIRNDINYGVLNSNRYIWLQPDQWQASSFNFDVMPDAAIASTKVTKEDMNGNWAWGLLVLPRPMNA